MLSGFFLVLGLSEILDLLFLRQEKIAPLSSLLLESFDSLKPAIVESPVINGVPFLHSSECLGGSILDGFDRDELFLASSVSVCASAGWGITISLFSSVAIPCSSFSVLLSAGVFLFKLIFF